MYKRQGFWRCISYWPKGLAAISAATSAPISSAAAINFCSQAAEIVKVASLPSTRNGRSFHLRLQDTMVLAYFASRVVWLPKWPLGGPAASQVPPRIQMPPRCLLLNRYTDTQTSSHRVNSAGDHKQQLFGVARRSHSLLDTMFDCMFYVGPPRKHLKK